ncbi:MAG: glucuronate isomerase [Clostridiales Family XIII bacterium]|jgi:glucuronate isomerase|nr:glucuronate isomerase [Clostridiales Family XIII bacterium]
MFINENFLLNSQVAKHLYHKAAKDLPIIDYHCHLDPKLIAENYRFTDITELWLAGDHYKWRAMRANGIAERFITGDASSYEKFEAWASTVENLMGNPLYHWTHLELKNYFGITDLLNSGNAREVYEKCNDYLAKHEVTTQFLIKQSNVAYIGTTDDPLSDLRYHKQITALENFDVSVKPSFRPDGALNISGDFASFIKQCESVAGSVLSNYDEFIAFLKQRIIYFHGHGGRISDHGFDNLYYEDATDDEIAAIYVKAANKSAISTDNIETLVGDSAASAKANHAYINDKYISEIHRVPIAGNGDNSATTDGGDSTADGGKSLASATANHACYDDKRTSKMYKVSIADDEDNLGVTDGGDSTADGGNSLASTMTNQAHLNDKHIAEIHEVSISDNEDNSATTDASDSVAFAGANQSTHDISFSTSDIAKWQARVLVDLAKIYAEFGWVMQLHFGALRSVNTRLQKLAGENVGGDCLIDQADVASHLNKLLDAMDRDNALPKTIIYNLNPAINEVVAATCGNFQMNDDGIKNKVQFGAGWWFNDTYRGMVNQMDTLSDYGLLRYFTGMLTDSRSFISYPRHEYFRRILCNYVGANVETGYYPDNIDSLKDFVKGICYYNANEYFGIGG